MTDSETSRPDARRSPLDLLGVLAKADGELSETSRVVELYTMEGLLQIWWHGDPAARDVALMCGGAMAIGYRTPGDLTRCLLDTCAAADLALRNGAERFAILGHSFGGAVAIQAASTFPAHTAGIVTFATQSAGCEDAALIGSTPLLLLHGERDSILGPENSVMVQSIAGTGEVRTFPGTDHLMAEAADEIAEMTGTWVREKFAAHEAD